jgi:hypothetical protein
MRGKSLFRKRIKLAGVRIPFNGGVEPPRLEGLEPCAKPRQLAWGEPLNGFLDVFGSGHPENISVTHKP